MIWHNSITNRITYCREGYIELPDAVGRDANILYATVVGWKDWQRNRWWTSDRIDRANFCILSCTLRRQ